MSINTAEQKYRNSQATIARYTVHPAGRACTRFVLYATVELKTGTGSFNSTLASLYIDGPLVGSRLSDDMAFHIGRVPSGRLQVGLA